jgi:hypothetical protein
MNGKPIDFQLLPTPSGYAFWWVSTETNEMLESEPIIDWAIAR